jgi:uncharacterized C2H2 Zn-finger protein
MARPKKGTFKCGRCGRKFSMAAHLARHMTTHGLKKKTGNRKYKKRARAMRSTIGRPKGIVSQFGLVNLGLDQLSAIMDAAREEARRRLKQLEAALS